MSSQLTASAPMAPARSLVSASRTAARSFAASGFSISNAILLFLLIALVALVVVIVVGLRMRHSQGLRSAHAQKIKQAAAADVAAIEEDDRFVSPDAPGRQEDDL